ncbi:ATPase component NikO of energizing module of nickel ECF transporter [Patulibacter medicamentivorans]|uniref:ATPase component NikO of energizing module of nickel ECF transporter n=2 Tax=Patulibacter medicamentivorans TaxID=1097667 RepID=H0E1R7_9ACTN|nr:CbiX/SirB N-terminal domain-containing protein [Patulibacter medicamentivorans]EHN12368.1 ATPase component NikO of energizing module of nickel ECF transporter [Patulibacter medicamentivorans]
MAIRRSDARAGTAGHPSPDRPSLVLVGHGSRDADHVEEFWDLVRFVGELDPELHHAGGFIELAEPSADAAIDRLVADGATEIVSVPIVLLAAGHLKNDGPATLARARIRHPGVRFHMARDLGIEPRVLEVAEDRIAATLGDAPPASSGVVLVGRGSSDPDASGDLAKVARLLSDRRGLPIVEPAWVSVAEPRVPDALERCRRLGATTIAVVPFFLFTGVLLHRIYEQAAAWAQEHPELTVRGGPHLGADRRLARVALDRYREGFQGDVRMNCDLCVYRVTLPGYDEKVGLPISLTPHGDAPAAGRRRNRRATRAPQKAPALALADEGRAGDRGRVRSGLPTAGPGGSAAGDARVMVAVRDLHFAYPDGSEALTGVDLTIRDGERVALLGPNGAGKTTLLLHLNGVLQPQQGEVEIAGTLLTKRTARELRKRVGIVFQDPDDQLFMPSIESDVAFGPANLGLTGAALEDRVTEALRTFDLEELREVAPHQLSMGQRRRAAVAGVLAMEPDLMVLDEPSSNLDPAARRELADVIRRLPTTTVLVTHDLPYALELCPRSIVFDAGQVVADGPTREILADEGFMRAHRLELPAGFNPLAA